MRECAVRAEPEFRRLAIPVPLIYGRSFGQRVLSDFACATRGTLPSDTTTTGRD